MTNKKNKICFFSFGYSHLFYDRLIKLEQFNKKFSNPDYVFISPNRTHHNFFTQNGYKVLYISDLKIDKNESFKKANNFEISSQKISIINLESKKQENIYNTWYNTIENFLVEEKVSFVLFSQQIEGLLGILISKIAKRQNIKCFVPHSTRFLGTSFFSKDQFEDIDYKESKTSIESIKKANLIIKKVREEKKPTTYPSRSVIKKPFFYRIINYTIRKIKYEKIDLPRLIVSFKNNFHFFTELFYKLKSQYQKKYLTIKEHNELPNKFIFFPLQVVPESSINIPNPFFIQQTRLIDLIRFNMPDDFLLVVKEHSVMWGRRSNKFYKKLNKCSGVRLINPKINTIEIIQKSSLTVSISGTACFEAFILKKPSIVFGKTFFRRPVNKYKINYNELNKTLNKYINREIKENEIINEVAMIYQNTQDFNMNAVDFDLSVLEKENLLNFTNSISI